MKAEITKQDIENLLEFATTHTADEAAAEFPMFGSDAIRQLYALTPEQRSHLYHYLMLRVPQRRRTVAARTPLHGDFTDTSGASSSWDMIVRLYEDCERPSHPVT